MGLEATDSLGAWTGVLLDAAVAALAFLFGGLLALLLRFPLSRVGIRSVEARPAPAAADEALPAFPRASAVPPAQPAGSAVFGHEVKNYICTLKGNAKLLRLASSGQGHAEIIDRIDGVVEKLERLAWKALEEGAGRAPDPLEVRTREAVDVVQVARSSARLHFSQSGGSFPCLVAEGVAPVLGDPHRLEQVFRNLYGNALEAGAATVSTRFRRIGGEIEIAVEDDGRGCPPEVAGRIFEPFFSTKEGKQARGLGLFIVQGIVANHGGRIRATTKNGRGDGSHGLVVYLNLPVAAAAPASAALPAYRTLPAGTRPFRTAA